VPIKTLEDLQQGIDEVILQLTELRADMAHGKTSVRASTKKLHQLQNMLARLKSEKLRLALRKLHRNSN
jgi:hypothetical protein